MTKITKNLFVILTIGLVVFSLASYVAPSHYFFEATSSLRMQYLCIGFFLLVFFTLTGERRWLLICGLCVVINFAEILLWYLPHFSNPIVPKGELVRLLQFNVLFSNQRHDDVIDFVNKENPTIAVFLEVRKNWAKELQVLNRVFP
ncbi:MAG: hypothetical protein Fur0025_22970 [Oscillatoriaceae cyanobacterium]